MPAILYRRDGSWNVFEDDAIPRALADGWYVLTTAGHPAPSSPEPSDGVEAQPEPEAEILDTDEPTAAAEPVKRKPGRPRKG